MRRFQVLFTLLALYSTLALAQTVVTGKVTDQQGQPVPFATIRIKGGTQGVSADENGSFSIQKYLALYIRGSDAWTEIRRLQYPAMATPLTPKSPFPWRYTYPSNEQTANGANYTAAAAAIGGDAVTTKLFWMQ